MRMLIVIFPLITGLAAKPAELTEIVDAPPEVITRSEESSIADVNSNEENRSKRQIPCCYGNPYPIVTLPSCSIPYTIINGTCYLATCPKTCDGKTKESKPGTIQKVEDPVNDQPTAEKQQGSPPHQLSVAQAEQISDDENVSNTDQPNNEDSGVVQSTTTTDPGVLNSTKPLMDKEQKQNVGNASTANNTIEICQCFCTPVSCESGNSTEVQLDTGLMNFRPDGLCCGNFPPLCGCGCCLSGRPKVETAGLMKGSGNGVGGNTIVSSMNVLAGPSCDDPCCNQNACMLYNSGNGEGGNRIIANANYINGGNLLSCCGNGKGGNCIKSVINIIGGNGGTLMSEGGEMLKKLCEFIEFEASPTSVTDKTTTTTSTTTTETPVTQNSNLTNQTSVAADEDTSPSSDSTTVDDSSMTTLPTTAAVPAEEKVSTTTGTTPTEDETEAPPTTTATPDITSTPIVENNPQSLPTDATKPAPASLVSPTAQAQPAAHAAYKQRPRLIPIRDPMCGRLFNHHNYCTGPCLPPKYILVPNCCGPC